MQNKYSHQEQHRVFAYAPETTLTWMVMVMGNGDGDDNRSSP